MRVRCVSALEYRPRWGAAPVRQSAGRASLGPRAWAACPHGCVGRVIRIAGFVLMHLALKVGGLGLIQGPSKQWALAAVHWDPATAIEIHWLDPGAPLHSQRHAVLDFPLSCAFRPPGLVGCLLSVPWLSCYRPFPMGQPQCNRQAVGYQKAASGLVRCPVLIFLAFAKASLLLYSQRRTRSWLSSFHLAGWVLSLRLSGFQLSSFLAFRLIPKLSF